MKQKMKKWTAKCLAVLMFVTAIPFHAFAGEATETLPEAGIDSSEIPEGAFYFASQTAELPENEGHSLLLKIARSGMADTAAAVKLTMLDITARYGEDYSVRVYDRKLMEGTVQDPEGRKSVRDYLGDPEAEEYNYSDALIDGSITAGDQLTDNETEEDLEEMTEELLEEKASRSEAVRRQETLTLSGAKELMTGIPDDKKAMTYSSEDGLLGSILFGEEEDSFDAFLSSGKQEVSTALSSAYVEISFSEGVTERYIEISPIDNKTSEGSRQAEFSLESCDGSLISEAYGSFTLFITDDEEYVPDTVQFSAAHFDPANGYVTVKLVRTGALNEIASVMLDSEEVTAREGVNYSALHSKVWFVCGQKERTVKIPVATQGLSEDGEFLLRISEAAGCITGEINEASVTVHRTDESFAVKEDSAARQEGREDCLPEAGEQPNDTDPEETDVEEPEDEALLGTRYIGEGEKVYDETVNLIDFASGLGDSVEKTSGKVRIYNKKGSTYCNFKTDQHYDWSGFRIDFSKTWKGFFIGYSGTVNFISWSGHENGKFEDLSGKVSDNKEYKRDYMLSEPFTEGLQATTAASLTKTPVLEVYSITPIRRIFQISLEQAEPFMVLGEDGKLTPNDQVKLSKGLEQEQKQINRMHKTVMEQAENGVLTTVAKKSKTEAGKITVRLEEDGKLLTRITGLQIYNPVSNNWETFQNRPEGTREIQFDFDNSFLLKYHHCVSFVPNTKTGGLKGTFRIRPVIERIPAVIKVTENTNVQLFLYGEGNTEKQGTENNGVTEYHYAAGDMIRYKAGEYDSTAWKMEGISSGSSYRVKKILWFNKTTGLVKDVAASGVTEVSPVISEKENRLVVLIPKGDLESFDQTKGIFASAKLKEEGNYWELEISTAKDGIAGVEYELLAVTKDKEEVPVWHPTGEGKDYSQSLFYYTGAATAKENVIYLSSKAADRNPYVICGRFLYVNNQENTSGKASTPVPAKGLSLQLDTAHYGLSANDGSFETMQFSGRKACLVKVKISTPDGYQIKTVKLRTAKTQRRSEKGSSVITPLNVVNIGNINLNVNGEDYPGLEKINVECKRGQKWLSQKRIPLMSIGSKVRMSAAAVCSGDSGEAPLRVEFVVIDGKTNEEKAVFRAEEKTGETFSTTVDIKAGNYSEYSTGDRLYARVITDRKVINPTDIGAGSAAMDSFAYPLVDTGVKFVLIDEDVAGSTAASRISASIPAEGYYKLPVIGELSMVTKIGNFSLEVQENNNGGVRLLFGKNGSTKLFDNTGKPVPESGKSYRVDTGTFEEKIRELSRNAKVLQEGKTTAAQSLGLSSWSFYPTTGIYLEFAKAGDGYQFTGGGGYMGTDSSFRYTHYMLVCGVPVYVGGKASVQLAGEFGLAPKEAKTYQIGMEENRPDQNFYNTLLENSEYNYVFRGKASGSGYTSETICGSLGVRGGFRLEMYYVNDSTIKNAYPGTECTGFAVKGNISFRAESMLLSAELPVCDWKNWKEYGVFSDPSADSPLSAAEENGDGNLLYSSAGTELTAKPRQEAEECFTANEAEELQLLGSGYSRFGEKTILENSYDQPSQQVLAFEAGGVEKLLMVYLSDDKSRAQNERTALMYTVYDRASGQWSTPKKVDAGSEHADFSPQLTELTGEEEILISWVSRNEELTDEKDYSAYLSSAEIYTARFDMKAAPEDAIHDVCCMTDDAYFNTNPKAIYDEETGDIQLYYLKSAVPSGIRTAEDLLAAVLPQQNKAEMAYLLFSGKEECWLTDRYFGAELADPGKEQLLLSVLHGQRFVPSQIGTFTVGGITAEIDNPVISDYDVITADMYTKTREQVLEEWLKSVPQEEQAKWADPQTGDEAADAYLQAHEAEINGLLDESCFSRGIYAYTVDADNSLDTDWDREIFLQAYDFENHTFTKPYRLTENVAAETGLQLVEKDGEAWLFWIEEPEKGTQDGSRKLKYVSLSGIRGTEDALKEEICTAGIDRLEGEEAESTFGAYRVFADKNGNLLAAWQEAGKEAEGEEQEYYSNRIFIAGYCPEKDSESDWSDGILLTAADTGAETVSDSLQLVTFKDEELNLFTNRYRLSVESEDGNVESSELVQTIYKLSSSVYAEAVEIVEEPEEAGEPFELLLTLENNGIKTALDSSFMAELILDGEVLDSISERKVGKAIPAGDSVEVSTTLRAGRVLSTEEKLRLTLSVAAYEEGSDISDAINLPLYDQNPEYVLEDPELTQEGDVFVLDGFLKAADPTEVLPTDLLCVYDTDGELIAKESLEEAGITGEAEDSWFCLELPAEKLGTKGGNTEVDLTVERNEEILAEEWVEGCLETAALLKLNGSSSDRLYLRPGQQLSLTGSYEGNDYYQDGEFLYFVEDEEIAYLDENVLIGESIGTTTLCMMVDPYGGYKEITVTVENYPEEESSSSGAVTAKSGPSAAQALSGSWKQEADGSWYFEKTDGTKATGWGYTGNGELKEYFHFNEKGVMDFGWYLDTDGTWYYLHETHDGRFGAMDRGWHRDASDNNWYYLDLSTGKMKTGWLQLGGNWYCLSTGAAEATWVQDKKGRWIYKGGKVKPCGAMYANETTPDGYTVGVDGAWKP